MVQALDLTVPDPWIGMVLDERYRVESLIGRGAMGAVYLAKHVKLGRGYAVKVLHPDHAGRAKLAARFEREARIVGMLNHRNIVSVVDVGVTPDGARYLVTELVDGTPLSALIEHGPMTSTRVLALITQLVDALAHAHEHGLVHRDLKPDNILVELDANGTEVLRLIDFGIALEQGAATPEAPDRRRLTTDGLVLGTPHYMAPEHATGREIDHRSDLFAVGVICFEMLTGRMPFDGNGLQVVLANVNTPTPAMADRVLYLEVDPVLEALTRSLMSKAPGSRIESARVLREILALSVTDPPAAARRLGLSPRAPTDGDAANRRRRSGMIPLVKGPAS